MNQLSLMAVGDISLISPSNNNPFLKISPLLSQKDILIGNLETALTSQSINVEKATALAVPANRITWLTDTGFDMLSIANNHILDAGSDGFNDTLNILKEHNIPFHGGQNRNFPSQKCVKTVNNISVCMFAYYLYGHTDSTNNISINRIDKNSIITDIQNAKQQYNHVIITLHWGIENVAYPSPEQIQFARHFIDSGATAVIGHHPHVIQGVEKYNNGIIAYSTGNFQFPRSFTGNTPTNFRPDLSFILKLNLSDDKLTDYEILPIKINSQHEPLPCTPAESQEVLTYIDNISQPIISNILTTSFWFEQVASAYLSNNNSSFIKRIKTYGISHLFSYLKWLISPFVLKCYFGIIRKSFKKIDDSVCQPKVDHV